MNYKLKIRYLKGSNVWRVYFKNLYDHWELHTGLAFYSLDSAREYCAKWKKKFPDTEILEP